MYQFDDQDQAAQVFNLDQFVDSWYSVQLIEQQDTASIDD